MFLEPCFDIDCRTHADLSLPACGGEFVCVSGVHKCTTTSRKLLRSCLNILFF